MSHHNLRPPHFSLQRLSLRGRFQLIMWLSTLAVVLATIIGIWKYNEFADNKRLIEKTSQTLLAELEGSFKDSLLMAQIQSDLILFIQTAQPHAMDRIVGKSQELRNHLPDPVKPLIDTFLDKADTLEIRMGSLRLNNNKVLSTGNTIIASLERSAMCMGNTSCKEGIQRAGYTFRQIRPLYMNGIVNAPPPQLPKTKEKIDLLLDQVKTDLTYFAERSNEQQAAQLLKLIDHFYELEEAIVTVAAIRERVVTSEEEVMDLFHSLNTQLAELSIAHNKQAMNLAERGLQLATGYVFLLFGALALITIFCILAFAFMANSILAPLDSLVNVLRRFTKLLRGVRRLSNAEKLQYQEIHKQIIDRHDEIGDVGRVTQALLDHIHGISEFRRKIENDKTCADIYQRLGKIFATELELPHFIIYEVEDQKPMLPVYAQPPQLTEEISITDVCRAKRTGVVVHSLYDPDTCPTCKINDVLDYFCLPMQAGGEIIGIIQFLLPIATSEAQKNHYQQNLEQAQNYIEEALPIMQAKQYARKLEAIATQDHLTGLYNRHYLDISLPQIEAGVKRRNSRLGVLLCDMDHFKEINDSYGHEAGDLALTELADIFRTTVRSSDLIVRYGGEEFLILLIDIKEGEDMVVAEKIRRAVADHPFQLPEGGQQQTISIGVAEFSEQSGQDMARTLRFADIALYKAKEEGRNCVVKFNRVTNNSLR